MDQIHNHNKIENISSNVFNGSDNSTETIVKMIMYLHAGYSETVLFYFWNTKNTGTFFLTCLLWFFISIFVEWLSMFRRKLLFDDLKYNGSNMRHNELVNETHESGTDSSCSGRNTCKKDIQLSISENTRFNSNLWSKSHIIQTIIYFFQIIINYLLMFVAMTLNIWLCLSITLGSTIGYFMFGRMFHDYGHHR